MADRPHIRSIRVNGRHEEFRPGSVGYVLLELFETTQAERDRQAHLMDEFRVVAVVSHDDGCRHTEKCLARSPDEALDRLAHWPLSTGYQLESAVVEMRSVTEWTEYKTEEWS